ncbi:MAG: hypothetical protein LBT83_10575 [Tannerella sp.]|jgi:hypothetical protein|nr:hypothetical protein [Tannerella sp.]
MERITLEYDANNVFMQSYLNTAIPASFKVVETPATVKELTPFEQSLEDIKCGRVTRIKNMDNMIEEILNP